MTWSFLLFAFCIAVITGAVAATTLARLRPEWSDRRRLLAAALLLPALTLLAALVGLVAVVVTGAGQGDNMQDLALAAIAAMGGGFALLAFFGGLVGAGLRQRGMRR